MDFMAKLPVLPEWSSSIGKFLLKCFAWIVIAVFVVFAASYFVKLPPNRADLFSVIEILFGIVITALTIVAAFVVSFQWSVLERNIREFENQVRQFNAESNRLFSVLSLRLVEANRSASNLEAKETNLEVKLNEMGDTLKMLDQRTLAQKEAIDARNVLVSENIKMLEESLKTFDVGESLIKKVTDRMETMLPALIEEKIKELNHPGTLSINNPSPLEE